MSELNTESLPPIQEEPPVRFRVPSCPELDKDVICQQLKKYEQLIYRFEAIILWRKPIQLIVLFFLVNFVALFVYYFSISIINVFIITVTLIVALILINNSKSFRFELLPKIESAGNIEESNRIFTLEELSVFLSTVGSRVHCFWLSCEKKAKDMSFFGQIIWIGLLTCAFIFFKLARTFWTLLIPLDIIMILPGFLFHPSIHPMIHDYLQWLMMIVAPKVKDE